MAELQGKVAVITGASRGIGRAIAEALAQAGAAVVVSSRKQEVLDEVAEAIRAAGGQALTVAAHTGDSGAVQRLIERTVETFGGVDILVNNAATNPHFGPLLTAEESHWQKILDVNLVGYFRTAKAVVPHMERRGGGKIVNIASIAGLTPLQAMGVYSVAKAGVIMLTKALALELAERNIQVNAVAPGLVKTRFSRALWEPEDMRERVLRLVPQKRFAAPEEIAALVRYLVSPEAKFITGEVIVIDGGQHLSAGRLA
ncbi:MAG TPA: SDR family oxidoreductase [Anaerolineae bacterium]|nr:SDR family oxidoreductase [Anaerolineae bacterium]HID85585.1 SDR family oxidoreductase [Anaerolineales bacterium]HIQ09371.1 SDR family oxidoreductase [Anaerolineaceae bacterium]